MGGGEFSLESGQTQAIEVIFSPTSERSMSDALIAFGYNCYSDASYLTGVGEKGDSVSIQKISNGYNLLKCFLIFPVFSKLVNRLLERFPNAFPILRQLLGL